MNKTLLRIAFADDDTDDHLFFYKAVKNFYVSPMIDCFLDADSLLRFYTDGRNILPHIIFLDKNMPGNYDYDCLLKIKTNPLFISIPVIIYSTSSNDAEISTAIHLGASSFITKPVSLAETTACLSNAIMEFVPHNIGRLVAS